MRRTAIAAVVLLGTLFVSVDAATAAGTREGDLVLVSASSHQPIDHGGSATRFSLRLPQDASCPGDSAHDQWRIQSFLVPASVDPAPLTYELQGPKVEGGFPLFDVATHPLSQLLLRENDVAGKPGYVDTLPDVDFKVFPVGMITPGTYRIGLACTIWRKTAKYWDTSIVVVASSKDHPAGFEWRLASAPEQVLVHKPSSRWPMTALALVAALLVVGLVVRFRRTR